LRCTFTAVSGHGIDRAVVETDCGQGNDIMSSTYFWGEGAVDTEERCIGDWCDVFPFWFQCFTWFSADCKMVSTEG
jgi:hypothetical protein